MHLQSCGEQMDTLLEVMVVVVVVAAAAAAAAAVVFVVPYSYIHTNVSMSEKYFLNFIQNSIFKPTNILFSKYFLR